MYFIYLRKLPTPPDTILNSRNRRSRGMKYTDMKNITTLVVNGS